MQYKIEWSKQKQTKVGPKIEANVSANGEMIEGVTLWPRDWPNVMTGHTVEADLVVNKNGQYTNKTLYPTKTWQKNTDFKTGKTNIAQAMEIKREGISLAQENKAEGVKISSTIRMAVDIALAKLGGDIEMKTPADIQAQIRYWREWLLAEWDNINNAAPFNN